VKLQSLLDLALGADAQSDDIPFREDVRVTMATTGLYEWLLRIVNVSGVIGEENDIEGHDEHHKKGKDKEEKKPLLGPSHTSTPPVRPNVRLAQPSMLSNLTLTLNSRFRSSFRGGPFYATSSFSVSLST
jgi:hypothetical protein